MNELATKRFCFSNLSQNKESNVVNLSAPVPPYDNAAAYLPGDLVTDNSSVVFECLEKTIGNNTTTAFWLHRGTTQYVSIADMVLPVSGAYNHKATSPSIHFNITIYTLNNSTGFYTNIVKSATQTFSVPGSEVQVNFTSLKSGKYRVTVNDDEVYVYFSEEFFSGGYFGVLDIYTHLPPGDDYSLFDAIPIYNNAVTYQKGALADDGTGNDFESLQATTGNNTTNTLFWKPVGRLQGIIREVDYTIRFANRRAFWKYITRFQRVDNIRVKESHDPVVMPFTPFSTDPVGHPGRKDFFVSDDPLPIRQNPGDNNFELLLLPPHDTFNPAAPKADAFASGALTRENDNFFCNIFLNY